MRNKHDNFDPFASVYRLKRSGKLTDALNCLFNSSTWKLNSSFTIDRNHAWYFIGTIYFDQGEYEKSKEAFKRSTRARPDDAEALWALGNCYSEMGRPKMSERYIRKALALRKRHKHTAALTLNLANSLFDQGRFPEALAQYQKVLRLTKDKTLNKLAGTNSALANEKASGKQR